MTAISSTHPLGSSLREIGNSCNCGLGTVSEVLGRAVITPDLVDPVLNKSYIEMAQHYRTTLVPARSRKLKDKAACTAVSAGNRIRHMSEGHKAVSGWSSERFLFWAEKIGPFIGMLLSQHGSYSMIFAVCAIVSAISLVMAPLLSLRKMEFTEEQMKEMQGFKLSNFVESRVIPISSICLLIYLCYSSIVAFLTVYAKEIRSLMIMSA